MTFCRSDKVPERVHSRGRERPNNGMRPLGNTWSNQTPQSVHRVTAASSATSPDEPIGFWPTADCRAGGCLSTSSEIPADLVMGSPAVLEPHGNPMPELMANLCRVMASNLLILLGEPVGIRTRDLLIKSQIGNYRGSRARYLPSRVVGELRLQAATSAIGPWVEGQNGSVATSL